MNDVEAPDKIETEARAVGWRSPDELRAEGKEGNLLSAQEYLERGRAIMPFLRRDNEKLTRQLSQQSVALAETQQRLTDALKSIDGLEEYHAEMLKENAKRIREELTRDLAAANREGDHEGAARITAEIAGLKEPPPPPNREEKPVVRDYTQDPSYQAWVIANPRFLTDLEYAQHVNKKGAELKLANPALVGPAFYAALDRALEAAETPKPRSKVDGGAPPASATRSDGKSYADLPAEAKEACDKYEKKFASSIGQGKRYANQAAWRAKYCADYFKE